MFKDLQKLGVHRADVFPILRTIPGRSCLAVVMDSNAEIKSCQLNSLLLFLYFLVLSRSFYFFFLSLSLSVAALFLLQKQLPVVILTAYSYERPSS